MNPWPYSAVKGAIVDDPVVANAIQFLEGHSYSDEWRFINQDTGEPEVLRSRQKSPGKDFTFLSVCKDGLDYFLMYNAEGSPTSMFKNNEVLAAGGVSPKSYFMYAPEEEEPKIFEYLLEKSVRIESDLKVSLPYFACRTLEGHVGGESVYYLCGGGDGPVGAVDCID